MKTLFFIFTILFLLILPEAKAFAQSTPSPGSTPGTTTTPNPSDLGSTVTTTTTNGNANSSCTETAECRDARIKMQDNVEKIKPLSMEIGVESDGEGKIWKDNGEQIRVDWFDALYAGFNVGASGTVAALCATRHPWLAAFLGLAQTTVDVCLPPDRARDLYYKAKSAYEKLSSLTNPGSILNPAMITDTNYKSAVERIRDRINKKDRWMPTEQGIEKLNELANAVEALQKATDYYDQNCKDCFPGADVPYYGRPGTQHFDNYEDFRRHIESVINIAALSADSHTLNIDQPNEPWWTDLIKILGNIIAAAIDTVVSLLISFFGFAANG